MRTVNFLDPKQHKQYLGRTSRRLSPTQPTHPQAKITSLCHTLFLSQETCLPEQNATHLISLTYPLRPPSHQEHTSVPHLVFIARHLFIRPSTLCTFNTKSSQELGTLQTSKHFPGETKLPPSIPTRETEKK